jgi:hypothetical protein
MGEVFSRLINRRSGTEAEMVHLSELVLGIAAVVLLT